jgi:hypothetical protein
MSTGLAKRSARSLTKYNPAKGVKKIAAFEMAEKHFAKAKDVALLKKAIRAKLEAQAEFVLWWKTKGPGANHGGARDKSS